MYLAAVNYVYSKILDAVLNKNFKLSPANMTADELALMKTNLIGSFKIVLATIGGLCCHIKKSGA